MGQKKNGMTSSQRLGIVWLSAALLLIAAVAFFSSRRPSAAVGEPLADTTAEQNLVTQEVQHYQERRKEYRKPQYASKKEPQREPLAESMYSHEKPRATKQPLVVELNSADSLTLQLLHGIGPAYASRIVRYRERLGGFVAVDQLLEVYGFTPELVAHIQPSLRLDTSQVRPIRINSIALKQLARHPYVEYYQARDIVRLRSSGVRFRSADDLRAVPSMADSTLGRLLPYLDFSDSAAAGNE